MSYALALGRPLVSPPIMVIDDGLDYHPVVKSPPVPVKLPPVISALPPPDPFEPPPYVPPVGIVEAGSPWMMYGILGGAGALFLVGVLMKVKRK